MRDFIKKVSRAEHLSMEEMMEASHLLFNQNTSKEDIKDFLKALSKKGETANELAGLAKAITSFAQSLDLPEVEVLDICGTGGDKSNSFNISTTSAFVLAAAGVSVVKNGNRKISSEAGSIDILEAIGIKVDLGLPSAVHTLQEENLAFLFAPAIYPMMKRIGEIRLEIGEPTIFNLVGPLTNPFNLNTQYVGVYRPDFLMEYAKVLHLLGRERAVVVNGCGGLDEASLSGKNSLVLMEKGDLIPFQLSPDEVGLKIYSNSSIKGGGPVENADILQKVLKGVDSAYLDTVLLNAGIGLFTKGAVSSIQEGVKLARDTILSGKAKKKLEAIVELTSSSKGVLVS